MFHTLNLFNILGRRGVNTKRLDHSSRGSILSETGYLPEENTGHTGPFFGQNRNCGRGKH